MIVHNVQKKKQIKNMDIIFLWFGKSREKNPFSEMCDIYLAILASVCNTVKIIFNQVKIWFSFLLFCST